MQHTLTGHGVWLSRSARAMIAVTCALCTFLVASGAAAYAPMCNELAQSIDAPPPALPHNGGTIRAAEDCAPEHFAKAPPGAPDRADGNHFGTTLKLTPTSSAYVSPQERPPREPVVAAEASGRAGFASGIYRPPRHA